MSALRVLVAIAAVFALLAQAPSPGPEYFRGSWMCGAVRWTFAPLLKKSPWLRVVYGNPKRPDGFAIFGYVEGLHGYVYRDFHTDGSYANLSSTGPVNGIWTWTGPYYPAGGGDEMLGRILYTIKSPSQYDRTFQQFLNGQTIDRGGDTCRRLAN
ncbi:MAG: hypothetical protein ACREML_11835 [Vulcanimicrobiaceae bacterium]